MIFNIQHCSIHDGSGLRTLVFLKGCPLRCPWCSNPESQLYTKEIIESPVRCIGCEECRRVCHTNAIREDGTIDRDLCDNCFKCIDICYAESKKIAGEESTVDEIFEEIEKDKAFYARNNGGVTFSGGEPLTQPTFLREIAKKCHDNKINVAIESCGYGNFEEFKEALPYIDSMFLDIKIFNSGEHRKATGAGNEMILDNIKKISDFGIPIIIRTPVIPGYTASKENIENIAKAVAELPTAREYELLQYHNFGESKYKSLGRKYELTGVEPPSDDEMREYVKCANGILADYKKECYWIKNNNKEVIL